MYSSESLLKDVCRCFETIFLNLFRWSKLWFKFYGSRFRLFSMAYFSIWNLIQMATYLLWHHSCNQRMPQSNNRCFRWILSFCLILKCSQQKWTNHAKQFKVAFLTYSNQFSKKFQVSILAVCAKYQCFISSGVISATTVTIMMAVLRS